MSEIRIIADYTFIDREGNDTYGEDIARVECPTRGRIRLDLGEFNTTKGDSVVVEFDAEALAAAIAVARAKGPA